MARAHPTLLSVLVLASVIVRSHASGPDAASPPLILDHGPRPAMFLPLSPANSSSDARRHIRRSAEDSGAPPALANARMRLHDDLLLNGYYTTRLWIGTPPQMFALIVDTGSTVTYVPCSTCEQCGRHQDPKFRPDLSSTYQPVKCNSDCTCDDLREQCIYDRQYAEMSSSSGVLGEDLISFGNLSELEPQRAMFGCENVETGDLYSQNADGIMGLGRGDLSIVDQLVEKGVISDSFSLCYGGMHVGGGAMVLGSISPPPDMVFAYSDPARSPYYNIDLKEIHVAGKSLPLNPSIFDGKHGTVLDSGTTYAYLPEVAYVAFKDAIMKELHSLKQIRGPDPNFNDICFSGAGSDVSELSSTFPMVDMIFGNGQKVSLSPENYLFQHLKVPGAYCLGIFQNADPTTLLGGIFVRNTLTVYDRENSKIGFWKTNCTELWDRLHLAGPPPTIPSEENGQNTASEMRPTSAPSPSDQPHDVLPGELKIGQVTLKISLDVNYSDLKPFLSQLTQSIAHGLGISNSQVHLLNAKSQGNSSLITLAVLPLGSADYITNATALSIISRVAEHRIALPDTFGSYQLVNWEVEPLTNRSWWQQHYLLAAAAIAIICAVALLTSAIWFIWKRRQETTNAYKPVNEAVAEQELQPL